MKPKVLIPVALGTNRDADLAQAFVAAGAEPECVPLTALRAGERQLADYQLLAVPGGFSYGDALGAGRMLGLDLAGWFGDQLRSAAQAGMPMIGICNGFQALVRTGVLPGGEVGNTSAVLTQNASAQFECRWVTLLPSPASVWTAKLVEPLRCPIAHGEGRYVDRDLDALEARRGAVLRYANPKGLTADGAYPENPNGSANDVAGVTDPTGMILGLMPHPENHIAPYQDPRRGRDGQNTGNCLALFKAGVGAA